jgi:hypothetical protein
MNTDPCAKSLFERLGEVPDPRSRHGRIYPLRGLLAMLILGALHGEGSLRGMWMWGCKHWAEIAWPLGFWGNPHPPVYNTVWYVLGALRGEDLWPLREWMVAYVAGRHDAISVDGKVQEGSRRVHPPQSALEVVTAVAQDSKMILGQEEVGAGGQVAATVALLKKLPLRGQVVVADAGLLCRPVVDVISALREIMQAGGDYLGLVKDNQPQLKEALDTWGDAQLSPPGPGEACR